MNGKREVLLLLTDCWSDWEAAYATAYLNGHDDYTVKTVALDHVPKVSMGGLRAEIDYDIGNYHNFDNLAMVIMPGGFSWIENSYPEIAKFTQKLVAKSIPVAAICNATYFLGEHGFLNHVKHTGNSLEDLQGAQAYQGDKLFISAQAVADGGIITANGSAAVEFTYEIFKTLELGGFYEDKSEWFDYYKSGAVL